MSAVAFWNARKKQKRNPQVLFQLKDPETLVFKLKYIFGVDIFKKYKEMVSGSKNINSPIPNNVKEFENIPVDNDVHQDLSKRNGGNSTNSHV